MDLEEKLRDARNAFVSHTSRLFSSDPELERTVSRNVYEAFRTANRPAILQCLERYVDAEMDLQGLGDRGIGRLEASIPRYGAYFRKHLLRLDPSGIQAYWLLIFNNAAAGYFAHVAAVEDVVRQSTAVDDDQLFKDWIPMIYSGTIQAAFGQQIMDMLPSLVGHALTVHLGMHIAFGIKKPGFFSPDLTNVILHYHALAGFALRAMETKE